MSSDWRCEQHGVVLPYHVPRHIAPDIIETICNLAKVPVWCTWPLLDGWMVTGIGWAGDERSGVRATVVACSGPAPLGGPADVVLIAEEPGVGLGCRFAGIDGPDPGPALASAVTEQAPQAKIRAAGHPTPLWVVPAADDRSAYVGEAKGMWLYAVAWPAEAGYVLADHVVLHDLVEWRPAELVYGAPSPYLHSGV